MVRVAPYALVRRGHVRARPHHGTSSSQGAEAQAAAAPAAQVQPGPNLESKWVWPQWETLGADGSDCRCVLCGRKTPAAVEFDVTKGAACDTCLELFTKACALRGPGRVHLGPVQWGRPEILHIVCGDHGAAWCLDFLLAERGFRIQAWDRELPPLRRHHGHGGATSHARRRTGGAVHGRHH